MTHDITFCSNPQQCIHRNTCRRAFPPKDVKHLSFQLFWKKYQQCNAYWPTGEEK